MHLLNAGLYGHRPWTVGTVKPILAFKIALETFIREQHASRAQELPFISWPSREGDRFLIENADFRQKFGSFIGLVSASHWWSHEKLEAELSDKIFPPPPPFPASWSIDLLKIACILRMADASQIDERRAPGFLFALRSGRIGKYSEEHWIFQNKLTKPQLRGDSLLFASTSSFEKEEAVSWWLLYDTLKLVDTELRRADDIITRCRSGHERFSARRVANIESPLYLARSVTVRNWYPVDTAFSISDIPRLIKNLGGEQLYGQNRFVAIRELVQNAMDATRVRTLIDPEFDGNAIDIIVEKFEGTYRVSISDRGVGMSRDDIIQKLLSFGKSGWTTDASVGEYNNYFLGSKDVSGQYGIGFFSVFMVAKKLRVISRRFDASANDTIVLEFDNGLESRPVMYSASSAEKRTVGGTVIEFSVPESLLLIDGQDIGDFFKDKLKRIFATSEIKINLNFMNDKFVLDGTQWRDEPFANLMQRISTKSLEELEIEKFFSAVRPIVNADGCVIGRACLLPSPLSSKGFYSGQFGETGIVVSNGAVVCTGNFLGVLQGRPERAARDEAFITAESDVFTAWLSEQASIFADLLECGSEQAGIAQYIVGFGGNIGGLKFCEVGGEYKNLSELRLLLNSVNEISIVQDAAVNLAKPADGVRSKEAVSVSMGIPVLINTRGFGTQAKSYTSISLDKFLTKVISEEFCIESSVIDEYNKIYNGNYIYGCEVPIWIQADGRKIYAEGKKYIRNMCSDDVKELKFDPKKRDEFRNRARRYR